MLSHPILLVHTTKERGKNPMGKSSLKHGQENKILEILSSIILHHMITIPSSDLRLLKVFSQSTLVKMSATCFEDAQKSR